MAAKDRNSIPPCPNWYKVDDRMGHQASEKMGTPVHQQLSGGLMHINTPPAGGAVAKRSMAHSGEFGALNDSRKPPLPLSSQQRAAGEFGLA